MARVIQIKRTWGSLLALVLLVACSTPRAPGVSTSTLTSPALSTTIPPTRPQATSVPTVASQATSCPVTLQASARTLKMGEAVTITGQVGCRLGIPLYTLRVKDQAAQGLEVVLTPTNEVQSTRGASSVFTLASSRSGSSQVTAVLQAQSAGVTEISLSVYGETGQIDSSGRTSLYFVTLASERLPITVTAR